MSRFDDCLVFVLQWEGGFVNDPDDPGGATNKGVTQKTYDAWLHKRGQPSRPVASIPMEDVSAIYQEEYWNRVARDLDPPTDLAAFDTAVNCGVGRTLRWLANCFTQDGDIKECLLAKRRAHYEDLIRRRPAMAKFRKGWFRRLDAVAQAQ